MRKGFIETLAAVAIASLGFNAMAMAPVVEDIRDVIVGNGDEEATADNVFVWEDAFNLDEEVTDETPDEDIIWSYGYAAFPEGDDPADYHYIINGIDPLNLNTDDPANPPTGNRIDNQDNDTREVDGEPRTITIRDEFRSPLGGPDGPDGPYPGSYTPGILDEGRTVTLFASDGGSVGQTSFIIYSEHDADDGFSPRGEDPMYEVDFTEGLPGDWNFNVDVGTVNQSIDNEDGLCLQVAAGGDNDASATSAYPTIPLVANSAWEMRLHVTTDATPNNTPLWSTVYDNNGGQDAYGGEHFYYDNEGGANSPINRNDFRFWMMPISMQAPQFLDETNGFFNPGLDGERDMRLRLRMFDIGATGGYDNTGLDGGSICFRDLSVTRYDLERMAADGPAALEVTNFVNADSTPNTPASWNIDTLVGETVVTFSGGNARLASNGTMWNDVVVTDFRPGRTGTTPDFDDATWLNEFWPLEWEQDALYYIEFELSAPTQDDENNPPKILRIAADVPTIELITDHNVVPNTVDLSFEPGSALTRSVLTPRVGTPQKYAAFFYSHSVTDSPAAGGQSNVWRPRLQIIGIPEFQPQGRTTMTGRIDVHSATVQKVEFQ